MYKMIQTYSDGTFIYSVNLLWKYVNQKNIISKKIKLKKLIPQLKDLCWSDSKESFSPIQIIKNNNLSPSDYKRIKEADLRYPIIIDSRIDEKHNFNVVDGMHRLSKGFLLKKESIRGYIIDKEIMKKCILAKNNKKGYQYADSLTKKDIDKLYQIKFS